MISMAQDNFTMYNKIIESFYTNYVQDCLIQSFIEYYGEHWKGKIESLFSNLIIARCDYSGTLTEFQKRQEMDYLKKLHQKDFREISKYLDFNKKSLFQMENKEIEELISKNSELSWNLFIDVKYYAMKLIYLEEVFKLCEKYPDEKIILVGSNGIDDDEKDACKKLLLNYLHLGKVDTSESGHTFINTDVISLIVCFGYGIPLRTIIHEANHLLSRETIAICSDNQKHILARGISDSVESDFIYEIINDYMTDDIEDIFYRRWNEKNLQFYNYLFQKVNNEKSLYHQMDTTYLNIVRQFYYAGREIIKGSLISGEGRRIEKIITKDLYLSLNKEFLSLFDFMNEYQKEIVILDSEDKKLFQSCGILLLERLNRYRHYEETMTTYCPNPNAIKKIS